MDSRLSNDRQGLPRIAADRVRRLLANRLRRGGVATSRTDWHFDCAAQPAESFPGGWQVRVHTWRHWSETTVHFDRETSELVHRCIDRLSDPPAECEMTQDEAVRVVASHVSVPADARLVSFRHDRIARDRTVARLEWEHWHNGLRVVGDVLSVSIHPQTHQIVSLTRRWRRMTG